MIELTEELFGYAEDAIKTHGPVTFRDPAAQVPDMEDVVDLLLENREDAPQALHEFLDDDEERLDPVVRQNFVRRVLRAIDGVEELERLRRDPMLQELID